MSNSIILVGFMGSGKSSVTRELASEMNARPVDLDQLITADEGRTPEQIITGDGEQRFRQIESAALERALNSNHAQVIAAGGGAWTIGINRRLIAQHGATTVWLNAPFELCWQRIEQAHYSRPMARTREAAEELYETRYPLYDLAEVHIEVGAHESPEQIAKRIASVLKENSNS